MSLSSFCVVSNALRLNLFDLHSTKHDRKPKSAALPAAPVQPAAAENTAEPVSAPVVKEDNAMKKTLHVEGMMCCHCEARVKKALEALPLWTRPWSAMSRYRHRHPERRGFRRRPQEGC